MKYYPKPYKLRGLADLQLATNGGFESGTFMGWTTYADGYGIDGAPENVWSVGSSASLIGPPFESDEEGNIIGGTELHGESVAYSGVVGASAINNGATYAALYQDVTLPSVGLIELKYAIRWKNFFGKWLTPDVGLGALYDQGVDVVVTLRDPVTDAILATLFQASTESAPLFSGGGDKTTAPYEVHTTDISAYAGQAVRLKFENYAARFYQVVDIDAVEIVLLTPAVPALASPSDGATGVATSPTLSWDASPGAASYQLQVSTDPSFTTTVVDQSGITDVSYSVSGLADNTLYYWQVNATNGGGTSSYSATWSFTTSGPSTGPLDVTVDIKPGSDTNPINLKSKGVIPVAILSTADFDATSVDGATVLFAGASPSHGSGHVEDVDGDGDLDWLGHFKTQETNIQEGDTSAGLTGKTNTGQELQGSDSIQLVGRGSKDDDKDKGKDRDRDKDHDKDKGKDRDKDHDKDKDRDKDKNRGGRG
ncbi:MAG: fibronectin type III domain-containing protein [Bacteroidota bacterium]